MNDDFEQMLDDSFAASAGIATGQKAEGKVVSIGKEHVFLDLGTRSEGMLLRTEVEKDGELTVAEGDTIEVFTVSARDGVVMCALSIGGATAVERTDDKEQVLAQIQEAHDAGVPVEGVVKEVNKGGFDVTIMGQRAFCPISQIQLSFCEKPEEHLNKTYTFAIIKVEEGGRNIVLSRRQLLQQEADIEAEKKWATLKVGDIIDGTVSSLQPYGAFVDIGGVDGLVHVSEISHKRINHPEEVLEKGQSLRVQIKELDSAKKKIGLSLKSMLEDPWAEAVGTLSSGQVTEGTVVKLAQFGAFVEVIDGVEGLVHISNMSETKRVSRPHDMVSIGDRVKIRVLDIDPETRRIALALVDEAAEEEKAVTEDFRTAQKQNKKGMGTLGDLLGGSLKKK